jgi:hypothetical protein
MKFFLLFLFYTCLGSCYAVALLTFRFYTCWNGNDGSCESRGPGNQAGVAILLSIIFIIFTCNMARNQYEGFTTNTTAIELLKGWPEEDTPLWHGLLEAFGEPFGWRWFVPLPLHQTGGLTGYYAWSPHDDPDAYEVRDLAVRKHFHSIETSLKKQAEHQAPEEAEKARAEAVLVAEEMYRLHAVKEKPLLSSYTRAKLVELASQPMPTNVEGVAAEGLAKPTTSSSSKLYDIADGGYRQKRGSELLRKGIKKINERTGNDTAGMAAAMMMATQD